MRPASLRPRQPAAPHQARPTFRFRHSPPHWRMAAPNGGRRRAGRAEGGRVGLAAVTATPLRARLPRFLPSEATAGAFIPESEDGVIAGGRGPGAGAESQRHGPISNQAGTASSAKSLGGEDKPSYSSTNVDGAPTSLIAVFVLWRNPARWRRRWAQHACDGAGGGYLSPYPLASATAARRNRPVARQVV
jgi:hypothetical protein